MEAPLRDLNRRPAHLDSGNGHLPCQLRMFPLLIIEIVHCVRRIVFHASKFAHVLDHVIIILDIHGTAFGPMV